MARYAVIFENLVSYVVYVDADSEEEAEDLAYDEADFPYFPAGMNGDMSDWYVADIAEDN